MNELYGRISIETALAGIPEGCYPTRLIWISPGSEETKLSRMTVRGPFERNGWHADRTGEGKTPVLAILAASASARKALRELE